MITPQDFLEQCKKLLQDPRRRIQVFLVSLIFIYFVWVFLFFNPLHASKNALIAQKEALQTQRMEVTQKIHDIQEAVKGESVAALVKEQQELDGQIKQAQQNVSKQHILFVSMADFVKLKTEIINQQLDIDKDITLNSINYFPVEPWAPAIVDKLDSTHVTSETIYEHELEIKFQSNYFSAIQYIARLEKLPWNIYWDSLTYTVLTYPNAQVSIKLHIFSKWQQDNA